MKKEIIKKSNKEFKLIIAISELKRAAIEKEKVRLDDLEDYYNHKTNYWRIKIMLERDALVEKIEDKLNKEHKSKIEELKERLRLEREFKNRNSYKKKQKQL